MIGELACCTVLTLALYTYIKGSTKVPHVEFSGTPGPFVHSMNAINHAFAGIKVFSEPFVKLFGVTLAKHYSMTNPDLIRKTFSHDKAQGHMEMRGWWEIVEQYRQLSGKYGAFKTTPNELGMMNDMDTRYPQKTHIQKLARKRFMEYTGSPRTFQNRLDRVRGEADSLIEVILNESINGPIDTKQAAMEASTNMAYIVSCGFSYKQGTDELKQAANMIDKALNTLVSPFRHKLVFILTPAFIRRWIPLRFWPDMCRELEHFWYSLIKIVENHEKNYNADSENTCLLDATYQDYKNGVFSFSDMFHTVQALLIAAADTTSELTALVFLHLARFPEWQQKLYEELREKNFMVDRFEDAPITAAFIFESYRWTPIFHRTLFHTVTEPIEIDGHSIAPGSIISASTIGVASDPKFFPDPLKFDPRRFMKDEVMFKRNKDFMPFGYGRRSCPGKGVGEMQVLQYTVAFIRKCEAFESEVNPLLKLPQTQQELMTLFANHPADHPRSALLPMKDYTINVRRREH